MAKSIQRRVSAQEATILQENEPTQKDSRFECPICIYWLNEPCLTKCGHRFCKKCITSWIEDKQNPFCPVDNEPLTKFDLFPDNYTQREIQQMRRLCPNAVHGCQVNVSPLEMDTHLLECSFRDKTPAVYDCTFRQCGCTFQCTAYRDLEAHTKGDMEKHLNLLMTKFTENQAESLKSDAKLWVADKTASHSNRKSSNEDLLKMMYERIVILEQQNREKDLKFEHLLKQFARASVHSADVMAQYSGGVLIWKIEQLQSKIQAMRVDPNKMFYSNETYTSPHGYRYCARINISPKVRDFIGLHVHLMQSDNDYHLDWPFRGRIKISMIHRNLNETKHDTIMSKPDILAFHRPTQEISPRGFGFLEYARIADIKDFVDEDTLTLKIQLSIV